MTEYDVMTLILTVCTFWGIGSVLVGVASEGIRDFYERTSAILLWPLYLLLWFLKRTIILLGSIPFSLFKWIRNC